MGCAASPFAHGLALATGAPKPPRKRMPGNGAITLRSEEGVRGATDADMAVISQMIKDEKMNPLFLEKSNFLVADGDGEVLGAGQIRPLGSFFELASLVVREDARGQGIGSALVNELLELHRAKGWEGDPPSVLLLTIKSAVGFYTRLGFAEYPIGMAPVPMQMEAGAGSVLAKMATGESLVCMRFKYPSIELSCDGTGTMLKSFKKGT